MSPLKSVMIFSIFLGALMLLIILNSLGQTIYAVSAPTSGYNHGCSDAQMSNPADRYTNQTEKASRGYMQAK